MSGIASPSAGEEQELLRRIDACARTDRWSRIAEGILLALGAVLALIALAVGEGHAPADPAVVGAAIVGGLALAVLWPASRVRSRTKLVAWVAEELGSRELAAVHDTAARGGDAGGGPLAELAAARLNGRFEGARLRTAAQGGMWRFLAAPVLGGLALSWTDDATARPLAADVSAAMQALSRSATSAAEEILEGVGDGLMEQAMADAVLEVAREARALDPEDPGALDAWLEQAEELALELQREGLRSEALDAARAAAEAASLAAAAGAREVEPEDRGAAAAQGADGEVSGGGAGEDSLAGTDAQGTPEEGTMRGQPQPVQVPEGRAAAMAAARAAHDPRDAALVQEFLSRLPEPTPPRAP